MKICLVRPPILVPRRNITTAFTSPLGVAYVAGTLKTAGYEVSVIDDIGDIGETPDTRHPADRDCFV